jgi:integrase
MPKITKRLLDALHPNPGGDVFAWDTELKGFGIRLKPSGSASYIVQYRTQQGRSRRLSFAKVGTITPDQARTLARRHLAEIETGGDPAAQRREDREALTVAELCERYLEAAQAGLVTYRSKPKAASTIRNDMGLIARHIIPTIGMKLARDLDRATVQRMIDSIAAGATAAVIKTKPRGLGRVTGGPGAAARAAELLGGILSWAEKRGYVVPVNLRGLERYRGAPKDRVLTREELARLGAELRDRADQRPSALTIVRLIALTGLRRAEAANLHWSEIDAAAGVLRLAQTKTGRSVRPIGRPALRLLEALPRTDPERVFPGTRGAASPDVRKAVSRVFDAAGLHDARSHDLRRTFASIAADEGYSDSTIGELLGHARQGVTSRHYIRRPDAVLISAADKVAARIAAMLDGRGAEIVPLTRDGSR